MTTKTWISIVVVLGLLIGVYVWLNKSDAVEAPPPPPMIPKMTQETLRGNWDKIVATACTPAQGDSTADWTVIEIGDFQCPQCGKMHSVVENIVRESDGHARLLFLNWPLTNIHANAVNAALAALAAEAQGKFWPMYDAIYGNQDKIEEKSTANPSSVLLNDAVTAGLDITRFKQDWHSPKIKNRLLEQSSIPGAIAVQSTPTFLLRQKGSPTVYYFVGGNGQEATLGAPAVPGLQSLSLSPPWNGGSLAKPFDPSDPSTLPQAGPVPVSASGGPASSSTTNTIGNGASTSAAGAVKH